MDHRKRIRLPPDRGAEDALIALSSIINDAFQRKEYCLVVKVDISETFDNCWWPAILSYLIDQNCPLYLYRVIRSFLNNRSTQLKVADTTVVRTPQRGCPQGSMLAPLLWILQLKPLLSAELLQQVKLQVYADDIIIIARGTCREDPEPTTNDALEHVLQWCRS
jgi:hypothetical protein